MDQLIAFHRIFGSCVLGPPQKDYFFAVPWRGSFGRILTMQLEPPKYMVATAATNKNYNKNKKRFWLFKTISGRSRQLMNVNNEVHGANFTNYTCAKKGMAAVEEMRKGNHRGSLKECQHCTANMSSNLQK